MIIYVVQGNFGQYEWEDVNTETTEDDAKRSLSEYQTNDPDHPYRLKVREEDDEA